jgi:hypothetical protein
MSLTESTTPVTRKVSKSDFLSPSANLSVCGIPPRKWIRMSSGMGGAVSGGYTHCHHVPSGFVVCEVSDLDFERLARVVQV